MAYARHSLSLWYQWKHVNTGGGDGTHYTFQFYELDELKRVLSADAPRRPYFRIPHHLRTVNHWGQRKLLLSEIEFLTEHAVDDDCIVVYAGAAPGTHIPYLANLFPQVKLFLLYDPADFKEWVTHLEERVEVHQGFFTDEVAIQLKERYKNDTLLFLSDIRTADPKVMSEEEVEENVVKDMTMQMGWVSYIKVNPPPPMVPITLIVATWCL